MAASRSEAEVEAHQPIVKLEDDAKACSQPDGTSTGEIGAGVGVAPKRRKATAGRSGGVNLFPGRKVGK